MRRAGQRIQSATVSMEKESEGERGKRWKGLRGGESDCRGGEKEGEGER